MKEVRRLAVLEKLGMVIMVWGLKWDVLDAHGTWFATPTLVFGTLLFLAGGSVEAWLKDRFPKVNW